MKRKKPARPRQKRWADEFTAFEYEGTELRVYNTGMLTIKGKANIKNAAMALARHVLDEEGDAVGLGYNKCIRVNCKPGTKYTVEWEGLGVLQDDAYPEPKFWAEFKDEFERICALKAFL